LIDTDFLIKMLKTVLHSPFREHLTCATSINAYVSQKLENIELDQKRIQELSRELGACL